MARKKSSPIRTYTVELEANAEKMVTDLRQSVTDAAAILENSARQLESAIEKIFQQLGLNAGDSFVSMLSSTLSKKLNAGVKNIDVSALVESVSASITKLKPKINSEAISASLTDALSETLKQVQVSVPSLDIVIDQAAISKTLQAQIAKTLKAATDGIDTASISEAFSAKLKKVRIDTSVIDSVLTNAVGKVTIPSLSVDSDSISQSLTAAITRAFVSSLRSATTIAAQAIDFKPVTNAIANQLESLKLDIDSEAISASVGESLTKALGSSLRTAFTAAMKAVDVTKITQALETALGNANISPVIEIRTTVHGKERVAKELADSLKESTTDAIEAGIAAVDIQDIPKIEEKVSRTSPKLPTQFGFSSDDSEIVADFIDEVDKAIAEVSSATEKSLTDLIQSATDAMDNMENVLVNVQTRAKEAREQALNEAFAQAQEDMQLAQQQLVESQAKAARDVVNKAADGIFAPLVDQAVVVGTTSGQKTAINFIEAIGRFLQSQAPAVFGEAGQKAAQAFENAVRSDIESVLDKTLEGRQSNVPEIRGVLQDQLDAVPLVKMAEGLEDVDTAAVKAQDSLAQIIVLNGSFDALQTTIKGVKDAIAEIYAGGGLTSALGGAIENISKELGGDDNPFAKWLGETGESIGEMTSLGGVIKGMIPLVAEIAGEFLNFSSIIDGLVQGLQASIELALEFQKAQFQLVTAVRASQRVFGQNIGTIAEWRQEIARIQKQFGVFSEADVTKAVAVGLGFTRQFGFERDQVVAIIESSATLAEVFNTDITDAIAGATSLLQGQSRALERYGIDASVATFRAEALALGFKESYNELTLQEKAQARLNYFLRQAGSLTGDAAKAQQTLFGREQKAQASMEKSAATIGTLFVPAMVAFKESIAVALESLASLVTTIEKLIALSTPFRNAFANKEKEARFYTGIMTQNTGLALALTGPVSLLLQAWEKVTPTVEKVKGQISEFFGGVKTEGQEAFGAVSVSIGGVMAQAIAMFDGVLPEVVQKGLRRIVQIAGQEFMDVSEQFGLIPPRLSDVEKSLDPLNEELNQLMALLRETAVALSDDFIAATQERDEALLKATNELNSGLLEAEEDYFKEKDQLKRDYDDDLLDIENDLGEAILDATKKRQEGEQKAEEDHTEKLIAAREHLVDALKDAYDSYNEKLGDLSDDLHEKEIEAETDFGTRLVEINKDYRDKLLENEQDYVEDRRRKIEDAALDLQRAEEDYGRKIQEENDDYLLREIEDQEKHKLEMLRIEEDFQRKIRDIREKYSIQIEEAVRKRDARAILNLFRDRDSEIKKTTEDFEVGRNRKVEDYSLDRERERKRHEAKLAELKIGYERQQQEIRLQLERQLEDLAANLLKQNEEARQRRDEQNQDARDRLEEQLQDARTSYNRGLEDALDSYTKAQAAANKHYNEQLVDLQEALLKQKAEANRAAVEQLADKLREFDIRRAEALKQYNVELADLKMAYDEQTAELKASYDEQNLIISDAYDKQILDIGTKLGEIEGVNQRHAASLLGLLTEYYGVGGYYDSMFGNFLARYTEIQKYNDAIELQVKRIQAIEQGLPLPEEQSQGSYGSDSTVPGRGSFGGAAPRPYVQPQTPAGAVPGSRAMPANQDIRVIVDMDVSGQTDLFSPRFEIRVVDILATKLADALRGIGGRR